MEIRNILKWFRRRLRYLLLERLKLRVKGYYYVYARPMGTDDDWILVSEQCNDIMLTGLHHIGKFLIGLAAKWQTGLTYQAIGNDDTAAQDTNIKLNAEQARKQITTKTYTEGTRRLELRTFYTAAEATLFIKEAAVFGSSTAGAGADSGEMFNHTILASPFDNTGPTHDITTIALIDLSEVT